MSEILYGQSGDVRAELNNADEVEISAALINTSRQRATRIVNVYLKKAYPDSIPVTDQANVPVLLDSLTNDLATYYCKRTIHQGPSLLSDEIKEEYYERTIKILEEIRDGETTIPELASVAGTDISANRSAYTPTFDVDDSLEHVVDPNLESDIADGR